MPALHPDLLVGLAEDLSRTTARVLALRELLPAVNASAIVAARPQVLLQPPAELAAAVAELQELLQLPPAAVGALVEAQPLFLDTRCVRAVLDEMRRLLPGDAAAALARDPSWLLRLQRGQEYLGQHPDSQLGEQVDWQPPGR